MLKLTFALLIAVLSGAITGRFKEQLELVFSWFPKVVTFIVASLIAYSMGVDWMLPLLQEVGFVPLWAPSTLIVSSISIGAGQEAMSAALNWYKEREVERCNNIAQN